jgi:hypothetical protein
MHEELMNEDEAELVCETKDMFILSPRNDRKNGTTPNNKTIYTSKRSKLMSVSEIKRFLRENNIHTEGL